MIKTKRMEAGDQAAFVDESCKKSPIHDCDNDEFHDAMDDLGHLTLKESESVSEQSTDIFLDAPEKLLSDKASEMPEHDTDNLSTNDSSQMNYSDNDEDDTESSATDTDNSDALDAEEAAIKLKEVDWSEEEKLDKKKEANELKSNGNKSFKEEDYTTAESLYTDALSICPSCFTHERSVMYSNRAACKLRQGEDSASIEDCSRALKLNSRYVKCLLRRAELYEKTDKLDESLADYKAVWEIDPSIHEAAANCIRLEQAINERNEKMKDEMIGKLKDLGNMVLKPFGLSTSNFQLQQNPETGGYNVNFQR